MVDSIESLLINYHTYMAHNYGKTYNIHRKKYENFTNQQY